MAQEYVTPVYCPVCQETIDCLTHTTPEPGGMAAMVLGDARRAHAKKSPACTQDEKWWRGWDYGQTVTKKVAMDEGLIGSAGFFVWEIRAVKATSPPTSPSILELEECLLLELEECLLANTLASMQLPALLVSDQVHKKP